MTETLLKQSITTEDLVSKLSPDIRDAVIGLTDAELKLVQSDESSSSTYIAHYIKTYKYYHASECRDYAAGYLSDHYRNGTRNYFFMGARSAESKNGAILADNINAYCEVMKEWFNFPEDELFIKASNVGIESDDLCIVVFNPLFIASVPNTYLLTLILRFGSYYFPEYRGKDLSQYYKELRDGEIVNVNGFNESFSKSYNNYAKYTAEVYLQDGECSTFDTIKGVGIEKHLERFSSVHICTECANDSYFDLRDAVVYNDFYDCDSDCSSCHDDDYCDCGDC